MVLDPQVAALMLLIFDFDGTLFHLPVDWAGVRRELGLAEDAKLSPLLQRFMDSADAPSLAVVTRYELAAVARGSLTTGAAACLRASGVSVAIVTRNSRQAVFAALGGLEGTDRVLVVGREDVLRLKPDPDGLHRAMNHFGVVPRECVLVGDTYHDVEAARAAGVRSVIVHNPRLAYSPAGADAYVDDPRHVLDRVTG